MGLLRPYRFLICLALGLCLAIAAPWRVMNQVAAQTNPFYDSILKMENDWQQEYEDYFGTDFDLETMDIDKMSEAFEKALNKLIEALNVDRYYLPPQSYLNG